MRDKSLDKTKIQEWKNNVANSLQLPQDFALGAAIVHCIGNRELSVENYRGILEYGTEKICLQAKNCHILICGKNLVIDYYTNEIMKVRGYIHEIHYQ